MKTSVVLLCSGSSSRMNPFENKFLFEFLGKSLFMHHLEQISRIPFLETIHIVCNSKNKDILKKEWEKNKESELLKKKKEKVFFSVQNNDLDGMKGGILSVEKKFPKDHGILILSSNDIVENWFLEKFLKEKTFSQSMGKICGKKVSHYFPGGYLELGSEKEIKRIQEKPGEGNEPSDLINLVIHWFCNAEKVFNSLKKQDNSNDDAYEQCIQSFIQEGERIEAIEYKGEWQALKYPWHILSMKSLFLNTLSQSSISDVAYISPNAVINGPVHIEDGVRILDFAVLQGPCFIGKNSIIGNHTLIRESHIGEGCCIGHGSEIARSYLRNKVFTHQSYIGDSVVDNDVNFGAGCKTGNLRHDGGEVSVIVKNKALKSGKKKLGIFCGTECKFGVQNTFSPGVRIGKNCWTFPQVFINNNINENSFIKQNKGNLEYDIRKNKSL